MLAVLKLFVLLLGALLFTALSLSVVGAVVAVLLSTSGELVWQGVLAALLVAAGAAALLANR